MKRTLSRRPRAVPQANTYNLYNSGFSLNCAPTVFAAGAYQTDTIRDKALAFIG